MLIQQFDTTLTLCKVHAILSLETQTTAAMPFQIFEHCKSATILEGREQNTGLCTRKKKEHRPLWSLTYHARINVLQYDQLQKNPTSLF